MLSCNHTLAHHLKSLDFPVISCHSQISFNDLTIHDWMIVEIHKSKPEDAGENYIQIC